jgi:hypothetical protein
LIQRRKVRKAMTNVFFFLQFLPLVLIFAIGLQRADRTAVERWAESYGASTDGENRGSIERYVTRTRRLRSLSALSGVVLETLIHDRFAQPPDWVNGITFAVAGYLIGAVIAEMTLSPPIRGKEPMAVLSPRSIGAYLPRYAIAALVALPLFSTALVPVFAWLSPPRRAGLADVPALAGACAVGVLFAIVVGFAMRAVVRRPQPAASVDFIALDDAIRSSSLHALAGAAVALQLLLLGFLLSQVQGALSVTDRYPRFDALATILALLALAMSLASWVILGHPRAWRTRRPAVAVHRQ